MCSMNGSVSAPNSAAMKGTRSAIRPLMKCTSREPEQVGPTELAKHGTHGGAGHETAGGVARAGCRRHRFHFKAILFYVEVHAVCFKRRGNVRWKPSKSQIEHIFPILEGIAAFDDDRLGFSQLDNSSLLSTRDKAHHANLRKLAIDLC